MNNKLPQCLLGKKVYLNEKKAYTIKYQDNRNKDGIHVLLFVGDKPVIFAILKKDGSFSDSFFLDKKTNHASVIAINRYNQIVDRKAKLQMTQDDIKDALRSKEDAKMKNIHIIKLLVDEHLEDISNGWSSRLLYLQMTEFKTDQSLINASLREALRKANPQKAFYYLTLHRRDDLLPELIHQLSNQNQLLETIFEYYKAYPEETYLLSFLKRAAKTLPITDIKLIQKILTFTFSFDIHYKSHYFKPIFLLFYKRTKKEADIETKDWLTQISRVSSLKEAIRSITKIK
ncbi:hypothetical protein BKP37_01905 [Anaerobacillus alkalilacustris]|uniref:Uncharacterized protein n=1 Tax=Anaerobacillus alkalilacustris TaxID=393763 RepID=A0A1S2LXR1_9BACI|nr:hypothetical protein [Anaerobacillus alkalilacustris]OIJ17282.1 hypothetical protein BKP37_01905 [Anaerobacillus alkalilacustris]